MQVVELVQGIVLFAGEGAKSGAWTADDDRLARTIEILGPFPAELLSRGKKTKEFFDENGT
jgi:serine/threonine-protein kinase SRPK3